MKLKEDGRIVDYRKFFLCMTGHNDKIKSGTLANKSATVRLRGRKIFPLPICIGKQNGTERNSNIRNSLE